jgi:hypothetical protein
MIRVSLKDFVRTGNFGPVALDQTKAEVRAHLGEPDDTGGRSHKYPEPRIWKYGSFEFHFEPGSDRLRFIHADDFEVPEGGKNVMLDPWIIRRDLPREDLESALRALGLDFRTEYVPERAAVVIKYVPGLEFAYEVETGDPRHATALSVISRYAMV